MVFGRNQFRALEIQILTVPFTIACTRARLLPGQPSKLHLFLFLCKNLQERSARRKATSQFFDAMSMSAETDDVTVSTVSRETVKSSGANLVWREKNEAAF